MFSNILGGAAGFPVADLGDEVNQSVRFYGTQRLTRTFANNSGNTWTWSAWLKKTSNNTRDQIIFGTVSPLQFTMARSNNFGWTQATVANFETAVRRDTNAWYHRVDVSDGTDLKMYINGVLVQTWSQASTGVNTNVEHFLGGDFANRSSEMWDGYIAQVYFVDGTAVTDTSGVIDEFGKYNEDGVWVPENYSGTYGNNGFHLDFADSSDLGNDVSGNNNDFTASGFDTIPVALYSPGLTANSGGTMNSLANAFDGDTGNAAFVSPTGVGMTFSPATDIPFTSLEIFPSNNNMSATFDGTTTNTPTLQYTQVATNGTINSTTPLTINVGSGLNCNLNAIRINGSTVLIDNFDNDVDYLDTPTSNYPTINPLYPSTEPPEEGNTIEAGLGYTGKANRFGTGATTMALPSSGEYYWEHEVVTHADHQYFGVTRMPSIASGATTGFISFRAYEGSNWYVYQDSTLLTTGTFQITDGDVIGQAYNVDTGVYRVWINGTLAATNTWTLRPTDEELFVYGSLEAKNSNKFRVNYGQRDFTNTPPTGAKRLQTNNLPEPTIKKGNQHFGALTYAAPGSPSYPITIDGSGGNNGDGELDFDQSPDLVWIKMRNGTQNHIIFDTVRGASNSLRSDGDISEVTTRSNFAFATNGFTFSAADAESYQQNDSYVAWCWKAGGTAVSNTDGTITSSVSANTDAGFSIVSYTGNASNDATIGHGLNSPPECVIYKNRDQTDDWYVYHKVLAQSGDFLQFLKLNTSAAQTTAGGGIDEHPTASLLKVNDNSMINGSNDMIAYCWHSVEGFSKFGSYTANGDADGPFIYLGFKPAFILIKSATHVTNWHLYDSQRDPENRENKFILNPNAQNAEKDDADERLDFLSNGFKLRSVDNDNVGSNTYVYMAFAENPFGGENAAPATAQ